MSGIEHATGRLAGDPIAASIGSMSEGPEAGTGRFRFIGPNPRDVRLHQSAVLLSLQALGQVTLGFDLSVAQILLSLGTCAAIEISLRLWRERVMAWPASALLTGNGVALILRVPGTRHGDWWSLRGWWIFVGVAAVSLLSKYAIRRHGRHVFNPSNLGLVTAFVVLGSGRVDPQVLWWGDLDGGLASAVALIVLGGTVITGRLGLLQLAATFWAVFAALTAALAASGHCMTSPWHVGPVCGGSFWWTVALSPELLVFALFMITDPRTTPAGARHRLWFGTAVAVFAVLLMAPQTTEYATKVALLGSLTFTCALVPVISWLRRRSTVDVTHRTGAFPATAATIPMRMGLAALATMTVIGAIGLAGLPARPDRFTQRDLASADLPAPVLPAGFPAVLLDESVRTRASWYTQATAERRALDLVTDLELLADAAELGDLAAARNAAAGARLAEIEAQFAADAAAGQRTVVRYELHTITAVMVRASRSRQPSPEVGFEVVGTRSTTVLDTSTVQPTVRSTSHEPAQELWRVRASGQADLPRFLIVGQGERWEPAS